MDFAANSSLSRSDDAVSRICTIEKNKRKLITKQLLEKIASKHLEDEFIEVISWCAQPGSRVINNLGDLFSVDVTVKDGSNQRGLSCAYTCGDEEKADHLFKWIFKFIREDSEVTDYLRENGVFKHEVEMYSNVVPALRNLNSSEMPKICDLIYSDVSEPGKEVLVIEHADSKGFQDAVCRKGGFDLAHAKLVVEWLARFHALSHVLMTRHPRGGKEGWLRDNPWVFSMSLNPPDEIVQWERGREAEAKSHLLELVDFLDTDGLGFKSKLNQVFEKYGWLDHIEKKLHTPKKPFSTLCHLDAWFNNMLFKYDESDRPKDVLLLDFQMSRYCHPGNDLAFFLLTSTTKDFRLQHLDGLLQIYHSKLKEVWAEFSVEGSFYSLENVQEDYRDGLHHGLTFGLESIPNIFPEPEELEGIAMYDGAVKMEKIIKKNDRIQKQLKGILLDLVEAKIL